MNEQDELTAITNDISNQFTVDLLQLFTCVRSYP